MFPGTQEMIFPGPNVFLGTSFACLATFVFYVKAYLQQKKQISRNTLYPPCLRPLCAAPTTLRRLWPPSWKIAGLILRFPLSQNRFSSFIAYFVFFLSDLRVQTDLGTFMSAYTHCVPAQCT
jgi:hypothetical protein